MNAFQKSRESTEPVFTILVNTERMNSIVVNPFQHSVNGALRNKNPLKITGVNFLKKTFFEFSKILLLDIKPFQMVHPVYQHFLSHIVGPQILYFKQ